jgi:pimeloyl-ACP methyl ester carboxylesterase
MPTLLLHGERDRNVTADRVDLLLHELPRAQLTRYERAGHMLVLERADRFARDIDAFARRGPAGSREP